MPWQFLRDIGVWTKLNLRFIVNNCEVLVELDSAYFHFRADEQLQGECAWTALLR